MNKIIVYGFNENRLWFGRPTLASWVRCFFCKGARLVVKPIKGWEQFAHYPKKWGIAFEFANLANEWLDVDPLAAICFSEKCRGHELTEIRPWVEK
jgi:hypothetical protein